MLRILSISNLSLIISCYYYPCIFLKTKGLMKMRKAILLLAIIAGLSITNGSAANAAKSKKADKDGGSVEYVKMNPLVLPIIDNDGLYQILNLVVVIEVGGINDADKVKAKKIRLNDAYIQNMYGMLNEYEALKHGIIQVSVIKERLGYITDEVMEGEVETEVLLQVVEQRPL